MALLDELIDRYGEDAVLTIRPYVLDSGETLRWEFDIGGSAVRDIDVRIERDVVDPGWEVMTLSRAGEELEVSRWSTARRPYGPAAVQVTLGQLRRLQS